LPRAKCTDKIYQVVDLQLTVAVIDQDKIVSAAAHFVKFNQIALLIRFF